MRNAIEHLREEIPHYLILGSLLSLIFIL